MTSLGVTGISMGLPGLVAVVAAAIFFGSILGAILVRVLRQPPVGSATDEDADLDSVRDLQAGTLSDLRARIAEVQNQRDNAAAERERLMKGLEEISGGSGDGVTIALANAKELAESARKLGERDNAVDAHDNELETLQEELTAAEQLLIEVDTQRDALKAQLKDQSSELWRLRQEIQATQQKSAAQRARTMMLTRSNVRKTEVVANRIEDQLKRWVKKTGEANVNFSEHGYAVRVKDQFEKLDREFIDRYFSHVTNPEYSRGQRKAIRVTKGADPDGTEYGELLIALDDDGGRTLGLRFELRGGAPDATYVGFVLALYLIAMHRDFRDFQLQMHKSD